MSGPGNRRESELEARSSRAASIQSKNKTHVQIADSGQGIEGSKSFCAVSDPNTGSDVSVSRPICLGTDA
jgi:hypothetical protein